MARVTAVAGAELAIGRLNDFLKLFSERGVTQVQIAGRAAVPVSYLSDVKQGRRPMTELLARRLADEFDVNYRWLMGMESSMARPRIGAWVPIFSHPIEGEPRAHPKWNGMGLEIAGAAVAKLVVAVQPYVLRFGHNDVEGRLCRGDLVLISQTPNPGAEISVVCHRKKSFLARSHKRNGSWTRIATREKLPGECPIIGHCMGIVWASLCADD